MAEGISAASLLIPTESMHEVIKAPSEVPARTP
jgi:hypothetical protein